MQRDTWKRGIGWVYCHEVWAPLSYKELMNGLYFNEDYKGVIELEEYRVYPFFDWLKVMKDEKRVRGFKWIRRQFLLWKIIFYYTKHKKVVEETLICIRSYKSYNFYNRVSFIF
ncbi:hypothetical protein A3863_06445 (plasmid) [Priestia endophytica]|nr:hypothetical protein A3863_06445 [Priestia endophytica]